MFFSFSKVSSVFISLRSNHDSVHTFILVTYLNVFLCLLKVYYQLRTLYSVECKIVLRGKAMNYWCEASVASFSQWYLNSWISTSTSNSFSSCTEIVTVYNEKDGCREEHYRNVGADYESQEQGEGGGGGKIPVRSISIWTATMLLVWCSVH
jgi:hypothetical protein